MKRNFVSMFVTVGMLILGSLAFAQTDTQSNTATVTSVQTFSITAGNSITFTPSLTAAVTNSATTLSFSTNDGSPHKISVVATAGWVFTPSVATMTTSAYPVLSFNSATTTGGGSGSTTAAQLIKVDNTLGASVDIVTAITNVEGTATVTLGVAQITHAVTAGSYAASLSYTMQ